MQYITIDESSGDMSPAEIAAWVIGPCAGLGAVFAVMIMTIATDGMGPKGILGFQWYCQSPRTARYKVAAVGWFLAFSLLGPLSLLMIFFQHMRHSMDENFGKKRMQETSANDVEMATPRVKTAPDLSRATTLEGETSFNSIYGIY